MKQLMLIAAALLHDPCTRVIIIIYRGRIMAANSVDRLRDLIHTPSLEGIFAQLVEHRDLEATARDIASAIER